MRTVLTSLAFVLLMAGTQALAQTAPTEVVVKGTVRPKLAEEAVPPPLEVYTQSPRVELIALSDDGNQFAFVTHKAGSRLLTTYNVTDGSNKTIRLSEARLSAITWLDNNHILLSETQTATRSTCPSGADNNLDVSQSVSDFVATFTTPGFGGGGASGDAMRAVQGHDATPEQLLQNALSVPPCADYGVRSHDAVTIVDLRTTHSISLGAKMDGNYYDHMPLGLPKPMMIDGKMQLVGAFLELRDKSKAGQFAQRVYPWRVDPDTGRARFINDGGADMDRLSSYVDDWLFDASGQPYVRSRYTYLNYTFTIEIKKDGNWTPVLKRKIDAKAHTFAPHLAGLGRDGKSLLIFDVAVAADGQKRFHYYELSTDGKISEPLDDDATRDRPIFHPETGALAGFE
ncbi:MAG: S9 family peptidase, partial [Asticcacaulis sp.]